MQITRNEAEEDNMDVNYEMHWYSMEELHQRIAEDNPNEPWYRLTLLETMLFKPYYPLGLEKNKKGNDVPCEKYKQLNNPINGFKKSEGDRFLDEQFAQILR
ncbi:MAG: hypothetical protein RR472_05965 [Anaerovoracaceae bacterium]